MKVLLYLSPPSVNWPHIFICCVFSSIDVRLKMRVNCFISVNLSAEPRLPLPGGKRLSNFSSKSTFIVSFHGEWIMTKIVKNNPKTARPKIVCNGTKLSTFIKFRKSIPLYQFFFSIASYHHPCTDTQVFVHSNYPFQGLVYIIRLIWKD